MKKVNWIFNFFFDNLHVVLKLQAITMNYNDLRTNAYKYCPKDRKFLPKGFL